MSYHKYELSQYFPQIKSDFFYPIDPKHFNKKSNSFMINWFGELLEHKNCNTIIE